MSNAPFLCLPVVFVKSGENSLVLISSKTAVLLSLPSFSIYCLNRVSFSIKSPFLQKSLYKKLGPKCKD